jgi:hypothetical protein
MKLISNWKDAWKLFSVQAMALTLALLGAWVALPSDLKDALPHWAIALIAGIILAAGIIGRLVKQAPDA